MKKLNHPNINKLVGSGKESIRTADEKSSGPEVEYLALELCNRGELYDYVVNAGPFDEKLARYFMKQAFEAVAYCHQIGLAHRDIKCENMMLDDNYNLVLCDFGYAALIGGKSGKGYLRTKVSSASNLPPEIIEGKPYFGNHADMYAIGLALFIMVIGTNPFKSANAKTDHFY